MLSILSGLKNKVTELSIKSTMKFPALDFLSPFSPLSFSSLGFQQGLKSSLIYFFVMSVCVYIFIDTDFLNMHR